MKFKFIIYVFLFLPLLSAAQKDKARLLKQKLEEVKTDTLRASVCREISHYYSKNDTDSALHYAILSLKLAQKVDNEFHIAAGYGTLANIQRVMGRYDEALESYNATVGMFKSTGHMLYAAKSLSNSSLIYKRQSEYKKALQKLLEAHDIFIKYGKGKDLIINYKSTGEVYKYIGEWDIALGYFLKALNLATENDKKNLASDVHISLGDIYLSTNKLSLADESLQIALETTEELNALRSRISVLLLLAKVEIKKGNKTKVKAYYQDAITIAHQLEDPDKIALSQKEYASYLIGVAKYGLAESQLKSSFASYAVLGDNKGIGLALKLLGDVYHLKKLEAKALEYYHKALEVNSKNEFLEERKQLFNAISASYYQIGAFKKAYQYSRDAEKMLETIIAKGSEERMAIMQIAYESDKKDKQIELQNAQINEKEAVIKHKDIIENALLLGIVISVVLGLLIYRIYRIKVKSNLRLNAQKVEIENQNVIIKKALEERESLIKEIHHRVKNNLQIIASLLSLQSGKSQDENVKKILEEGQGRVRSMALIHQKLYENEDLKSIPFGEYLSELIKEIQVSFGDMASNVIVNIEAEEAFFDVDTAVPLGLIVNELTTNAFKYAYDKKLGAQFNVKLTNQDNQIILTISDNGSGLPNNVDYSKTKSLGLRLVRMLSFQLQGEYTFENDGGTCFSLKFAS